MLPKNSYMTFHLQIPPVKFMIFVCDCILELMDTALAKQKRDENDAKSSALQSKEKEDPMQDTRFDKWTDSPRSQNRYALLTSYRTLANEDTGSTALNNQKQRRAVFKSIVKVIHQQMIRLCSLLPMSRPPHWGLGHMGIMSLHPCGVCRQGHACIPETFTRVVLL